MEHLIYTLVRGDEWRAAVDTGGYGGSADDRRDGFLHFSTAAQVRMSAAKHRAGEPDLWLVSVATARLGSALRWEAASGDSSRAGLFRTYTVPSACPRSRPRFRWHSDRTGDTRSPMASIDGRGAGSRHVFRITGAREAAVRLLSHRRAGSAGRSRHIHQPGTSFSVMGEESSWRWERMVSFPI